MPGITMCEGFDCEIKRKCYRYTAKPCDLQSFFTIKPKEKDGKCEQFWDNTEY